MKQLSIFILSLALSFCTVLASYAQSVKGNKNIVTQERKVSQFSALEVYGMGDIVIKQGAAESVKVTTDENIQPYIETVNAGSVLVIRTKFPEDMKGGQLKSSGLTIEITVKDIQQLTLDAVGEVKIPEELKLSTLNSKITRTGNLYLNFACKTLNLKADATGNISMKGSADNADIEIERAGNLQAFEFAAKKLNATMNAIGNAELNAEQELSIDATAIGNLSYKGTASVKKMKTSGTGTVRKM